MCHVRRQRGCACAAARRRFSMLRHVQITTVMASRQSDALVRLSSSHAAAPASSNASQIAAACDVPNTNPEPVATPVGEATAASIEETPCVALDSTCLRTHMHGTDVPHKSIDHRARGLPTCRKHRARRVRIGHVLHIDLLEPRGLQRLRHVVNHGSKHADAATFPSRLSHRSRRIRSPEMKNTPNYCLLSIQFFFIHTMERCGAI